MSRDDCGTELIKLAPATAAANSLQLQSHKEALRRKRPVVAPRSNLSILTISGDFEKKRAPSSKTKQKQTVN
jgi:hypothetical protein